MEQIKFEGLTEQQFLDKISILTDENYCINYVNNYATDESETKNTYDLGAVKNTN